MRRGAPLACALLIAGCSTEPPAPPPPTENLETLAERMAGNRTMPSVRPSPEPETPLDDRAAAALAREFGLPRCSNIARLRDVRGEGLFAESWRVRGDDACFADWAARQRKYGMLERLVKGETKADLDRLPWLCGEDGAHVAQCSNQGRRVTLVIENPRFAPFLLFRRISREAK
ncbi:hypothetical protein ASG37_09150 [Sphingomonas sp. Leaf407]|uniref:hypothetical protein n=1 Tax=unclassified Sphingomonas TaxID=196159 RepID=UPI0006F51DA8|nr:MULTISPECIES: hypothetical protein [unclassified Sphingomonas]KQN39688.1 hypothetical protein ASE97_06440 [Sphingomonas sp. Leaf42]KQT28963.1 hypothetical protein ASG37_09150 [Sphingomonas sp. Leaf407]